ncbi:MAG TPA: hypothetical protein VLT59_14685 [Steroidobacteraceae bacterium]|nr:hypothetical protein [Steroidobacteraceae bacterium]
MKLPYRATTASGERIDVAFPLHAETGSAIRVEQMLSAILATLDRDIGAAGETSNGDVLQAMAMALAIRAAMIHAPKRLTDQLASELVATALAALDGAERHLPMSGRA